MVECPGVDAWFQGFACFVICGVFDAVKFPSDAVIIGIGGLGIKEVIERFAFAWGYSAVGVDCVWGEHFSVWDEGFCGR